MKKRKQTNSHILLLGNYGAHNLGDEAIFASLLFYCKKNYGETVKISALTDNHTFVQKHLSNNTVTCYPLFPVGFRSILKYLWPALKNKSRLRDVDFALFGGGGLFTDSVSIHAVVIWFVQFLYVRYYLGIPVVTYGQSIGPLHTKVGTWLTTFAMKRMQSCYVRDLASLSWLTQRGIAATTIHDPALHLVHIKEHTTPQGLHIAISLRPWKDVQPLLRHMVTILKKNYSHATIHLIPMQPGSGEGDTALMVTAQQALQHEGITALLHAPSSYAEVQSLLAQCDVSIGMRLHFCILSATVGTPFHAIAYSPKVSEIATELGMTWEDMQHSTEASLTLSIDTLVNNRASLTARLQKTMDHITSSIPNQAL